MVTKREWSVQFNSKIGRDWTEWQAFAIVVDIKLTFGLSVVQVKGRRHRFSVPVYNYLKDVDVVTGDL